jgi:hypothetical protein
MPERTERKGVYRMLWRWSRRLLIVLAGLSCVLWYIVTAERNDCAHDIRVIEGPADGDYDAVRDEEICDWFGSSDDVRVNLQRRNFWQTRTLVFTYFPDYGPYESSQDPVIAWIRPDHLKIAVNLVFDVEYKALDVNGIKITYEIGHVGESCINPKNDVPLNPNNAVLQNRCENFTVMPKESIGGNKN